MPEFANPEYEAARTLSRILPRLEKQFKQAIKNDPGGWNSLHDRLTNKFPVLFDLYLELYQNRYDFFYHLEDLLETITDAWFLRSQELRNLDADRECDPLWYQSNNMIGGVCYVDLFANDLEGVRSKIPYFKELGLTYLHLMPLFDTPAGANDGGYAVSDYRKINPSLGTIDELESLSQDLREAGISLALDLVFNHTSDEHIWAKQAIEGDPEFEEFYRIFPNRNLPDVYEMNLREIFPEEHPGAFTFHPQMQKWVWTTFHSYQWDLNYENPITFNRMAGEMLFLANRGVEVLRLDAIAFIWKEVGTNCENLPKAHTLIKAFNTVARIAAPSLLFKSEAIVHPDDVVKYISSDECQLSYNPLLMALLWNSLATRKVRLLSKSLEERFEINPKAAWVNYVRVHDDIGWTFSDEDAAVLGINANDHRNFLNDFYRGMFPGSFARGLPFQENETTGDCRISGTCASLAGLEKALLEEGPNEVEFAIRRILLIYGIVMTVGGNPLIYLGDEIGTLNDYTYKDDPEIRNDSRWVHRVKTDWERYRLRNDPAALEGRIYQGFLKLIKLRKNNAMFSHGELHILQTENDHVLGFTRPGAIILANFSESAQSLPIYVFNDVMEKEPVKIYGTTSFVIGKDLKIDPLDFLVIKYQV